MARAGGLRARYPDAGRVELPEASVGVGGSRPRGECSFWIEGRVGLVVRLVREVL